MSLFSVHIKGTVESNDRVFIDEDKTFVFGEGSSKENNIPRFIEVCLFTL